MEHLTWKDAQRIVLAADQMLDQEGLEIIKWRGEQAYYEEVLRRAKDDTILKWTKESHNSSRDKMILQAVRTSVAKLWGIPYADLMDGTRKREKVEMRYLVFTVTRFFSLSPDGEYAKLFPSFNRVSINHHALQKAQELMDIDYEYKVKYQQLQDAVGKELKRLGVIW